MKKIEYFLDCSSPWTYLSFRGVLDLMKRKDFNIIWKPVLVVEYLIQLIRVSTKVEKIRLKKSLNIVKKIFKTGQDQEALKLIGLKYFL